MKRLKIRTRLTLGAAAFGAIVLAIALVVARAEVSTVLENSAVELARGDLAPFITDLEQNPGEDPDAVSDGLLIVVKDPTGRVVVNTSPHDVFVALPETATPHGQFDLGDDEGDSFVVVSDTVSTPNGTWSLWAARDVTTNTSALRGIDAVFLLMGLGLLALLVLASWLLARNALRPVEVMRRHAEHLADDELLPVDNSGDELSRLAATLNELVTDVRDSADRERRIVSDAAHELRTPIAGLRAQIELSRRRADDPARVEAGLTSALESLDRLGDLATNLLELSRLDDAGPGHASASAAELGDAVLRSIDTARTRAAAQDVEINDRLAIDDADRRFGVDPISFGRIADNLLSNALTAIDGHGRVDVSLETGDRILRLRVADDGPGAPEDFLPVAFERFSRADDSRSTGGSGLGLALVRAIVELGGGHVEVANLSPGFVVTIAIPDLPETGPNV